jgi:hypothetical protein
MSRTAVAVVCLISASLAMAATALGATVIHFEPESLPALEAQLHQRQVHALSFHPAATTGHIHVSLSDGRHMTVAYVPAEQAHLIAVAQADGARVVVAKAKPKAAAKPAKHKLRYVAAGILVIVIVVVAAVLLIDRRRKLGEGGGDEAAEGAPAASSSGETT